MVEHSTDTRAVPGSNPGPRTTIMDILNNFDFTKVRGILLDLDNTVYEYKPCHTMALKALYDAYHKINPVSYDVFLTLYENAQHAVKKRTDGQGASHSRLLYIQNVIEETLGRTDIEKILDLEEIYWSTFVKTMKLRDEVRKFLVKCKENGVIVCLITDLTASIQFRKIQALELIGLFDFIVTSEEAGMEKPDPGIFSYALEKMNLTQGDVVMIGDDITKDIDGARNYNIKAIQYT